MQLKALLQKEMTRKQFLVAVGILIVSVLGMGSILKFFTGKDHSPANIAGKLPNGYGGKDK